MGRILTAMKTALLKVSDKNEIAADDATRKNETRGYCPECKTDVRLHRKGKNGMAAHFEHLSRDGPSCSHHYDR